MSYLDFTLLTRADGRKTDVWSVASKRGDSLGVVVFRPAWRKFVFAPENETVYDAVCLREIADFCEEQTRRWKDAR